MNDKQSQTVPELYTKNIGGLKEYLRKDAITEWGMKHLQVNKKQLENIYTDLVNVVELAQDPFALLNCQPSSLIQGIYNAHKVGLRIDSREHAYLVPFRNKHKGVQEAKMIPGWRGYVSRLRNKLQNFDIHTGIVLPGDKFSVRKEGAKETYEHVVAESNVFNNDYRNMTGAYCYIEYTVDGVQKSVVTCMSKNEITKIENTAKKKDIWNQWFDQQVIKTLVRRACKLHFNTITEELDILDNEGHAFSPMEESDVTSQRASRQDIEAELEKEMQEDSKPTDDKPRVQDAEFVEVDAGDDEDHPQIDEDTQETVSGSVITEKANEASPDASSEDTVQNNIEDMAVDEWDGKTIIVSGREVQQGFANSVNAGQYLLGIMRKRNKKSSRDKLMRENNPLINLLIRQNQMGIITEMTRLITEGENDADQSAEDTSGDVNQELSDVPNSDTVDNERSA